MLARRFVDVSRQLSMKSSDGVVKDHCSSFVFEGEACIKSIKSSWWHDGDNDGSYNTGPAFLMRCLVAYGGPSHLLTPQCDPRSSNLKLHQGMLCTGSTCTFNMTPVEQLSRYLWMLLMKNNIEKNADDIFDKLFTLFTSHEYLGNDELDNCVITFVNLDLNRRSSLKGTRFDIISLLHFNYLISFVVYCRIRTSRSVTRLES